MEKSIEKNEEAEVIASAVRTIKTEGAGIDALCSVIENGMGRDFAKAVGILSAKKGRVIVTGVGKSGHIGNKIAATLASTGTPSFFVHPAEANHGDLGMIARDDAIIVLSWSGETTELNGILAYSKRFSIPLIAITSGEKSTLAGEADVLLCLPKVAEACPHGLAPTTSTLMQLALGDALAVALLEAKGFTADGFKDFHPAGKLGASLSKISDVMHIGDRLPVVQKGSLMGGAVRVLSEKRMGCVGVVDVEGQLCGIVTDGDLARNLDRQLSDLLVDDIMTKNPVVVQPTALASTAMNILNEKNIGALFVVDDANSPIGIVHFHDLLRIGVA